MSLQDSWDKLNLKISEVDFIKRLIAKGVDELQLHNLIVDVHNRAFVKGKTIILDELEKLK